MTDFDFHRLSATFSGAAIVITLFLTGCAVTQNSSSIEQVSFSGSTRKEIVLYYATTRRYRGGEDPDKFFDNRPETPPSRTRVGRYPGTTTLDGSDFLPGNLRVMDESAWIDEIRSKAIVDGKAERTILIFVHGYRTSFTGAAESLARLETGFNGSVVPIFYTWPSRASLVGYTADENEAGKSANYFASFLNELRSAIPEADIAVVAHSMGNRVAVSGIDIASRLSGVNEAQAKPLKSLALVAADIDREQYSAQFSKSMKENARRVVIYVSAKDKALAASRRVHDAADSRLGQNDPEPYSDSGTETVDATEAGTDFLGHGYFASNRTAINDIVLATRDGVGARFRPSLRPMPNFLATKYWWLVTK